MHITHRIGLTAPPGPVTIRRRPRNGGGRPSAFVAVGIALLSAGRLAGCGGSAHAGSPSKVMSEALAYANCMRANGVLNYPDPKLIDGSIDQEFNGKFNPDSPAFKQAAGKCAKPGVPLAGTLPPG